MSDANPSSDDEDPLAFAVCNRLVGCGKRKPLEQFREGGHVCKACEKRERQEKNEIANVEATNRAAIQELGRRVLEQSRRVDLNLPALSAVASGLIDQFGGLEAFLAAYHGEIVNAMTEHPGSAGTLKAFHQVTTLVGLANQQEVIRDLPDMDDAELVQLAGALARRQTIDAKPTKRLASDEENEE